MSVVLRHRDDAAVSGRGHGVSGRTAPAQVYTAWLVGLSGDGESDVNVGRGRGRGIGQVGAEYRRPNFRCRAPRSTRCHRSAACLHVAARASRSQRTADGSCRRCHSPTTIRASSYGGSARRRFDPAPAVASHNAQARRGPARARPSSTRPRSAADAAGRRGTANQGAWNRRAILRARQRCHATLPEICERLNWPNAVVSVPGWKRARRERERPAGSM